MSKKRLFLSALFSVVMLVCAVICSFAFGARTVTVSDMMDAITKSEETSFAVSVIRARIPRTVFGLIAGGSLGVSGALMQSITRNPIADPGILGVNTGASLFVVCGMAFLQISTAKEYIWLALLGAGVTAVLVYLIASLGSGGMTPLKLALSGAAISTALSSVVSTIMLPNSQVMDDYRFWQMGSIGGANWDKIFLMSPFFVGGFLLAIALTPSLNTLALGDEMATSLGVNPKLVRLLGAIGGVVLCGATTALAGPIGFVGLMIPHFMRLLFGNDLRFIIPFSAIGGGCLLLFSDVIGRLLGRPGELEVGIVTAFLGAPVLILIIRKAKVRAL